MANRALWTALAEENVEAFEELRELQKELDEIDFEACQNVRQIELQFDKKRKPLYTQRNELLSATPKFWLTALWSHPMFVDKLSDKDRKIFKYWDSLEVTDMEDSKKGYYITFNFLPNPYFENTKLTKVIKYFDEGTSTPSRPIIKWKKGMGPAVEKVGQKRPRSFFSWFESKHRTKAEQIRHDAITEMITEELWACPLEILENELMSL